MIGLVNDLLTAAALIPVQETVRRGVDGAELVDRRSIEPVTTSQLITILRDIAGALADGRDPLPRVLAGTGYDLGQPIGERWARLGLLSLSAGLRAQLGGRVTPLGQLFAALVSGPLAAEALYAASGSQERYFVNTGQAAAADQHLLARTPTVAALLAVTETVIASINAEVAAGHRVLAGIDQTFPLHRHRTVGQLARERTGAAAAAVNAIIAEASALAAAPPQDRAQARARLRALTGQWARTMQKLSVLTGLGDAAVSGIPVLTRTNGPDHREGGYQRTVALAVTSFGWLLEPRRTWRRTRTGPAGGYAAAIAGQVSAGLALPGHPMPVPPPEEAAAAYAADLLWERVHRQGGALFATTSNTVYLRAVRRDGTRLFAVGDPARAYYRYHTPREVAAWRGEVPEHIIGRADPAVPPRRRGLPDGSVRQAIITEPVQRYLDRPGALPAGVPRQDALGLLDIVLAEVAGLAGDGERGDEWNALFSRGLALLPPAGDNAYAGSLPGVDPAGLAVGGEIGVNGLIHAYSRREAVPGGPALFVITRGAARDVSVLPEVGSDRVMFDRGLRLLVTGIGRRTNGRLVIELREASSVGQGDLHHGDLGADPFADLPEEAVAVRQSDGAYLTVPSGIGALSGMADPEFFTADHGPAGTIHLQGTYDGDREVGFSAFENKTRIGWRAGADDALRDVAYLAMWYLAKHAIAKQFKLSLRGSNELAVILRDLGLTETGRYRYPSRDLAEMVGPAEAVYLQARNAASRQGWILRDESFVSIAVKPADPFTGLPEEVVAIRRSDGALITVPIGVRSLDGVADPQFFTAFGWSVSGVGLRSLDDDGTELSFDVVEDLWSMGPGPAAGQLTYPVLAIWYLARHATSPRLRVREVTSDGLAQMLTSLGMVKIAGPGTDLVGARSEVHRLAAEMAIREGLILREGPVTPVQGELASPPAARQPASPPAARPALPAPSEEDATRDRPAGLSPPPRPRRGQSSEAGQDSGRSVLPAFRW